LETEKEVLERANSSAYGLSAYAMTRDLNRMFRLGERLEAGTHGINNGAYRKYLSLSEESSEADGAGNSEPRGLKHSSKQKHISIGNLA
jgi:succinate-semialdehyde dehydrogenase / glutarate-semialdehyde dehydrogenase